ncbi:MAG TPA: PIN domain-containing protein [Candidatus Binatia bacterium]|nr:PIN domain-containing protein [Candidatus Binatia bacterium]
MLYVTDTHPLVYFSTGKTHKLGKHARRAFQEAERGRSRIVIPLTVLEEILRLSEDSRIRLALPFPDLVARYQQEPSPFFIQDYTTDILLSVAQYPTIRDPFDRVIVATAHTLEYPLITNDSFLQEERFVPVVW